MGWHYSGDPSASPVDEVRFLTGDTDPQSPMLQDEEIGFTLAQTNGVARSAAVRCLEAIIYRLAPLAVDESLGSASISYSKVLDNYRQNLKLLKASALGRVTAFGGGIRRIDDRRNADPRLFKQPDFTKDMMRRWPGDRQIANRHDFGRVGDIPFGDQSRVEGGDE